MLGNKLAIKHPFDGLDRIGLDGPLRNPFPEDSVGALQDESPENYRVQVRGPVSPSFDSSISLARFQRSSVFSRGVYRLHDFSGFYKPCYCSDTHPHCHG